MVTKKKSELLFFVEPHSLMRERQPAPLESGSRVVKEHAFDCDVANIMARYSRTGQFPANVRMPFNPNSPEAAKQVGDVVALSGTDYGQQREIVAAARRHVADCEEKLKSARTEFEKQRKAADKADSSASSPTPNATPPAS